MKIDSSFILTDARKITNINQKKYLNKDNDPLKNKIHKSFLKKVDTLKKQYFSVQSLISKDQTLLEGLKEIKREINLLKDNFSTKTIEEFYQNVYNITKKYSYNQENIISKKLFNTLYEKNIDNDKIVILSKEVNDLFGKIQAKIEKSNLDLMKLHVSSENIIALGALDNKIFKEIKSIIDTTNAQVLKKVHTITSSEEIKHLLND